MAGETTLTLVGNLTADPEVRTVGSGASVANFTIASTPRTFNRDTNQWEDGQALFMRCAAWRELADHVASSLSKGMRVIAQGRISQRSYQANDGTNRTVVEMTVDEIGPSLRYATAQVTRQSSGSGFSGNRGGFAGGNGGNSATGGGNRNAGGNAGNGGYQGGAGYSGGSGYSGGASAPAQSAPAADPWGSPAQSNDGFSSFGASSDFGGDSDEPEF
ncbi:single-stranded DNA-binding protein [Bifidobacterium sp.]|jgi:single-strand DNA-binding protein|uniref:single-stranded DNA-binding protein n=1 Tax=Bifidobacterium sp. TaxID=41200 RepID=UPI0025C27005|nr:single-stranded DNA-binding protein [Bifidobacterium sp.]MCH4209444.1 single-stranded DNA-binding protein [Bifidobacterium sp.]